jgi:ribosomal protein S18 acetylase RimI-like enzyme
MKIKKMAKNDLLEHFDDFFKLFAENTRGHVIDQTIGDDYIMGKAKELLDHLTDDKAVLFGVFINRNLVGFLWSYPRIFLEESRMYINSLIIDIHYRGKGFGKQLIDKLESYAISKGIFIIDVGTASFKKDAIKFYEQNGYISERIQFRKDLKKLQDNQ